jgi:hypothetical protein
MGKVEKEYEILIKEESTYPKGTILLKENTRIEILNKLISIKKYLIDCIEKFPITINLHPIGINNRKKNLEEKINEVEKVLDIFGKKKVFLK